jgi:Protein of unknown function, DUF547
MIITQKVTKVLSILLRVTVALIALTLAVVSAVGPSGAHAATLTETFQPFAAGSKKTVDHSTWSRLLGVYLVASKDGLNRVAYKAWSADDRAALKTYLKALQATDVASLDRAEQFAFWANLYNAATVDVVLDKYPVKSIKDINLGGGVKTLFTGGPWQAKLLAVGGQQLSLDMIENDIMRPIFKDPRVHYAINCASIGCPNLGTTALTGATLETTLDANARAFINSPRGFLVEGDRIKASSIYDWFKADFGGSAETVLVHARKYAAPELKAKLAGKTTINSYDYDWALAVSPPVAR